MCPTPPTMLSHEDLNRHDAPDYKPHMLWTEAAGGMTAIRKVKANNATRHYGTQG